MSLRLLVLATSAVFQTAFALDVDSIWTWVAKKVKSSLPSEPQDPYTPGPDGRGRPLPLDARGGLREFSVVYTDRAVNHMSTTFQECMKDLHRILCKAYNAKRAILIPGSGSYGMESVARQFIPSLKGEDKNVMVLRNGYFSYRWTDIFTQTGMAPEHIVLKSRPLEVAADKNATVSSNPYLVPAPLEEVIRSIEIHKPSVLFAAHIETSTGIVLSDKYIVSVSRALRKANPEALFVLDGIAAGVLWADMKKLEVDVYLTAPQKGWTGPASVGIVMLAERAYQRVSQTQSNSMVLNLRKWRDVMESYLKIDSQTGLPLIEDNQAPGFSYYTTMPTDALLSFRDAALECERYGFQKMENDFRIQGEAVVSLLEKEFGLKLVAAPGYRSPGVVVIYIPSSSDVNIVAGFKKAGLQIAAGVPLQIGYETKIGPTFRLGLFGMDKIYAGSQTIEYLRDALKQILGSPNGREL